MIARGREIRVSSWLWFQKLPLEERRGQGEGRERRKRRKKQHRQNIWKIIRTEKVHYSCKGSGGGEVR